MCVVELSTTVTLARKVEYVEIIMLRHVRERCRITAPATAASGAIILNNQFASIFTMPEAPNKSCDRAECVPESESGIQLAYKYISNRYVLALYN